MICPNDASKDFDDLTCQDCKRYFTCFNVWQHGSIWGKEVKSVPDILKDYHKVHDEPIGDNYPNIHYLNKEIEEIAKLKDQKKISQEDIEDLKIDLELFGRKNAN